MRQTELLAAFTMSLCSISFCACSDDANSVGGATEVGGDGSGAGASGENGAGRRATESMGSTSTMSSGGAIAGAIAGTVGKAGAAGAIPGLGSMVSAAGQTSGGASTIVTVGTAGRNVGGSPSMTATTTAGTGAFYSGGTSSTTAMDGAAGSSSATTSGGVKATGFGVAGQGQGGTAGSTPSGTAGGIPGGVAGGSAGSNVGGSSGTNQVTAGSGAVAGAAGQTGVAVSGWSYRRSINVVNEGAIPLTGFQVAFELDTTDKTRFRGDCGDIRVKTKTGAELPHWIETDTCGTLHTVVWIRVAALPIGTTTLDLQYGNPVAADPSDGSRTFPDFFEDFLGNALDTTLWTSVGSYRWVDPIQANGELRFAGTSLHPWPEYWQNFAYAESDSVLNGIRGLVLEARARRSSVSGGTGSTFRLGLCEHPTPTSFNIFYVDGGDDVGTTRFASGINLDPSLGQDGDALIYGTDLAFTSAYHRFTIRYNGTDASGAVDDAVIAAAGFTPTNLLSVYLWTNARTEGTSIDARFDWVLVRQYAELEPVTLVGAETSILQ